MRPALTIALITLLCTCGRAQNYLALPQDVTSVAFIKGSTGFLIDSLTIRTTLDTVPYGFTFPGDTLLLDIEILDPADELTLETFARGHSFGRRSCWVDGPTADVYLSIQSGRNAIDSVGLSPIDRLYRKEVAKIKTLKNPFLIKRALKDVIYNYYSLLFTADFLSAYADMPNLNRQDIRTIASILTSYVGTAKRHPRYKDLLKKNKLMFSILPGKLSKYDLYNREGQPVKIERPKNQFYVINFYDSGAPTSRRDHKIIAQSLATDSLFTGVPIISISRENPAKPWQQYVREGDFSWPHYHENKAAKKKLTEKMQIFPTNTYVLVNQNNLIEGVYDDIAKLAAAVMWRKVAGKIGGE